uniref:Eta tubulin n=1 Tax=Tetraselmis sp. GSL018 TaxID=582737 RepID=A0A061RYF0_9CHLO
MQQRAKGTGESKTGPPLEQVNLYIARCLLGVLLPFGRQKGSGRCHLPLRDLVMQVCPDAEARFVEVHHSYVAGASAGKGSWLDAARCLGAMMGKFDPLAEDSAVESAGTLVIARCDGRTSSSEEAQLRDALPRLATGRHVWWREDALKLIVSGNFFRSLAEPVRPSQHDKGGSTRPMGVAPAALAAGRTLTAVANRSSTASLFARIAGQAARLCDAGAYVHWYERHGCDGGALVEAADFLQKIADCYACRHSSKQRCA